jgi:hypothetical protein
MFVTLVCLSLIANPKPGIPLFLAHTTGPTVHLGTLAELNSNLALKLANPDASVAAGDLIALRRGDQPLPPPPISAHVRLANGDVIRLDTVLGGDANGAAVKLSVTPGVGREIQILPVPLSALSVLWIADPLSGTPSDPTRYAWVDRTKKHDTILLRNGDVVSGTLDRFNDTGTGVLFKPTGEKSARTYDLASTVAAVALDPSLTRVRTPKGTYVRIVTADGSRVSCSKFQCDGKVFEATTLTGGQLTLPLAAVIAVDVMQGKATYLSDLKPKAVKEEAFGGVVWPWVADRSVKGNPLRMQTVLGEETFDKGLGLHSKTTLTYDLAGKYRRFEAIVGLDAFTGRRGAVDVRILVDGQEQKIEGLTGLTAAGVKVLGLDVTKAKELTLVVDYGPGGDIQDDVNFADARLVE